MIYDIFFGASAFCGGFFFAGKAGRQEVTGGVFKFYFGMKLND